MSLLGDKSSTTDLHKVWEAPGPKTSLMRDEIGRTAKWGLAKAWYREGASACQKEPMDRPAGRVQLCAEA